MSSKSILFFTILFGFFLGCSDSSTEPETQKVTIDSLFPLKIGNSWSVQVKEYSKSTGMLSGTDTTDILVTGNTTFKGLSAFSATFDGDPGVIYKSGNDLYFVDMPSGFQQLVARYPMTIGQTDKVIDTLVDDTRTRVFFKLLSSNESVTVPAGTFSTYHFQEIDLSGKAEPLDTLGITNTYFTPGTGFIRQTIFEPGEGSVLKLTTDVGMIKYTSK